MEMSPVDVHNLFVVTEALCSLQLCFSFLCVGTILDSMVCEISPGSALELGTYCGYSTVRIARLLAPGTKLITLEFNPDYAKVARQVIEFAGLQEKVGEVFEFLMMGRQDSIFCLSLF